MHLADCIRGWAEATTANPPAGIVSGTAEPAEVVRGLERDLRGQCTPWPFGEVGA